MRAIPGSCYGKLYLSALFAVLLAVMLLAAPLSSPDAEAGAANAAAGAGSPDGIRPGLPVPSSPAAPSGNGIAEELGLSRPYYAPEAARAFMTEEEIERGERP